MCYSLQWRHNGRESVSNHQPHDFYSIVYSDADQRKHQRSASLAFAGNSPGTGEFPAQMASYVENVSIWWRLHGNCAHFILLRRIFVCLFCIFDGRQLSSHTLLWYLCGLSKFQLLKRRLLNKKTYVFLRLAIHILFWLKLIDTKCTVVNEI